MTEKELLQKYESERQPVECWTRVMGYFRPISHFNKGHNRTICMVGRIVSDIK